MNTDMTLQSATCKENVKFVFLQSHVTGFAATENNVLSVHMHKRSCLKTWNNVVIWICIL